MLKRAKSKEDPKVEPEPQRETVYHYDLLSEKELDELLEAILDDMNINEGRREPFRSLSMEKKKELVINSHKTKNPATAKGPTDPQYFIKFLNTPNLSIVKLLENLESLRVELSSAPISWIKSFGTAGIRGLFAILERTTNSDVEIDDVQLKCLLCLKTIVNSSQFLREMIERKKDLETLCKYLDCTKPKCMLEVVRILCILSSTPPDGHEKILDVLSAKYEQKEGERFSEIVKGFQIGKMLTPACLNFINIIVSTPEELHYRIHLRNELIRRGFREILESLTNHTSEEVRELATMFLEGAKEDNQRVLSTKEPISLFFDDVEDCFDIVKNSVLDTKAESYLLFILQSLFYLKEDEIKKAVMYRIVEKSIEQIVFQPYGFEPDFKPGTKYEIEAEKIIGRLTMSRRKENAEEVQELENRLKIETKLLKDKEVEYEDVRKTMNSMPGPSDLVIPYLKPWKLDEDLRQQETIYEELDGTLDQAKQDVDVDNINACFEHLQKSVAGTQAEKYLLALLHHLMFIPDNFCEKTSYYMLIEECVSQIVFHKRKSGKNPKFVLNLDQLVETLTEKIRWEAEDSKKIDLLKRKVQRTKERRHDVEDALERGRKLISQNLVHGAIKKLKSPPQQEASVPTMSVKTTRL